MSHQFAIGDTVRVVRTGLEAEVAGFGELDPSLVLCAWLDWRDDYQEVYFMASELVLLKAAEKKEARLGLEPNTSDVLRNTLVRPQLPVASTVPPRAPKAS